MVRKTKAPTTTPTIAPTGLLTRDLGRGGEGRGGGEDGGGDGEGRRVGGDAMREGSACKGVCTCAQCSKHNGNGKLVHVCHVM